VNFNGRVRGGSHWPPTGQKLETRSTRPDATHPDRGGASPDSADTRSRLPKPIWRLSGESRFPRSGRPGRPSRDSWSVARFAPQSSVARSAAQSPALSGTHLVWSPAPGAPRRAAGAHGPFVGFLCAGPVPGSLEPLTRQREKLGGALENTRTCRPEGHARAPSRAAAAAPRCRRLRESPRNRVPARARGFLAGGS
jgi:hypothetical protein